MKVKEKYFYDAHCHLMDFSQPDFFIYINELKNKFGEEAIRFLFSPDYIIDINNKNAIKKVANLFNVMSHSQAEILEMIENDLEGLFLKSRRTIPIVQDDKITIRNFKYDKYVLTPLVMDFNVITNSYKDLYYNTHKSKKVDHYADMLIKNIKKFYKISPESRLEIYPFLGINTPAYSVSEIKKFLNKYFRDFSPKMGATKDTKSSSIFAGIKLYPPLGFDPWPEDDKERVKVRLIYKYAEENRIPITTHCDDGGFRVIPPELAWKYTSPERYKEVLKAYPNLKINFAHLGKQYYRSLGIVRHNEWRQQIFKYMLEYPYVYSDLAFSGINQSFFKTINKEIADFKKKEQTVIYNRIMFGSDFNICLPKIESYTEYIRVFEKSVLTDDAINKIGHINPERFLFEE